MRLRIREREYNGHKDYILEQRVLGLWLTYERSSNKKKLEEIAEAEMHDAMISKSPWKHVMEYHA